MVSSLSVQRFSGYFNTALMPPARASNQKPSSVSLERAQETFLRPHHIPLLGLIFWTTHHDNEKRLQLSLDYALHVFRVVLIEVTEVFLRLFSCIRSNQTYSR